MTAPSTPLTIRYGRFVFEDWSSLADLTQADAWRLLAAAEAYVHLAGRPAPTAEIIEQLRQVRAAVREARRIRRAGRRVPT